MEERRGCALLWRHQERHGGGRSRPVFRSQAGRRFRLPLQAGRSTGIEDALPLRAMGGNAGERRMAAQRRPRQSLCAALRGADCRHSRRAGLAGPVEANAVFLEATEGCLNRLRERGWKFYTFIGGAARFMFAWDTDLARVEAFAATCANARHPASSLTTPATIGSFMEGTVMRPIVCGVILSHGCA